jgi:hypothetical protein
VKLVRLRRPKIACFPSYVDSRPKTNAVILLDMGHTKKRLHTGGIWKGRKSKTWMWLMCSLYRSGYSNIKLAEVTMGKGLGSSEEVWLRWTNVGYNTSILETIQGISLYRYLYLKLAKTPCFSYYFLRFSFYKIREQESRTGSTWRWGECGPNNV